MVVVVVVADSLSLCDVEVYTKRASVFEPTKNVMLPRTEAESV